MVIMNGKIGEKVRTEWKKVRLGEVAEINKHSVYKNFPHNEIEYIDISSVGTGVLLETKKYELKNASGRAKRLLKAGNTILSTVRPNRRSFLYVKNPQENLVVSTVFAVLNPTTNIDGRFLYYVIADQRFTDYLSNHAKGSAYPAVDTNTIANTVINFPPLPTQHKIASILSAYDDLIENNNRRIKILEEMAQAIYKEWFVNLRFPGHEKVKMVKSELGMIPEGWEVGRLGEIVNNINEMTTAGDHLSNLPYVPIDCIPRKHLGLTEFKTGNEAQSSLVLFKRKAILPDAEANRFYEKCALFAILADKIRAESGEVDISDIMGKVERLLDDSIAAEGYIIKEPHEPYGEHIIDLSQIDFEALRKRFLDGEEYTDCPVESCH